MKNKPIKLIMDVSPLTNNKKSGVGYYTEGLLDALATSYPDTLEIIAHSINFMGKNRFVPKQYSNVTYRTTRFIPSKLLNILRRFGIELPLELFVRQRADFSIFPNFVGYPSLLKTPSAAVIHDLGYIDCPEFVAKPNRRFLERYVPRSVKRSNFLITISKSTEQAIRRNYNIKDKAIVITYIPPADAPKKSKQPPSVKGKFILFVGTLEPRKNFIALVRAYMLLPKELRKEYSLVLGGNTGWYSSSDMQEIKDLQMKGEEIITTGYLSEEEKEWLYQHASLFMQPSHYEGFGMPILEAMSHGTPCAISDIDVFHEVAGESAAYFNQQNPDSIAETLIDLLQDKQKLKYFSAAGLKKASSYSWNKTAKVVYDQLAEALSRPKS